MIFKIGMTTRTVETRLGEWRSQCHSKEWILCGTWPLIGDYKANFSRGTSTDEGTSIDDEDSEGGIDSKNNADDNGLTNLLRIVKRRTAFCAKLERLIHIELADLVINTPYLNEDFPNAPEREPSISSSKLETLKKSERCPSESLSTHRQESQECIDCGYNLLLLSS